MNFVFFYSLVVGFFFQVEINEWPLFFLVVIWVFFSYVLLDLMVCMCVCVCVFWAKGVEIKRIEANLEWNNLEYIFFLFRFFFVPFNSKWILCGLVVVVVVVEYDSYLINSSIFWIIYLIDHNIIVIIINSNPIIIIITRTRIINQSILFFVEFKFYTLFFCCLYMDHQFKLEYKILLNRIVNFFLFKYITMDFKFPKRGKKMIL